MPVLVFCVLVPVGHGYSDTVGCLLVVEQVMDPKDNVTFHKVENVHVKWDVRLHC